MGERDINKERLELALEAAGLDLWENNLVTGEVTRKAIKTYAELGYSEEEAASFVDDMFVIVHPDDISTIKTTISEYLAGVTAQYRCEFRLRSKNGAWIWYANYGKSMDRDGNGQRFIGVTFNIDDRKRKEKELAVREQASRSLIENSPDTIARYDNECRRFYVNPALSAMAVGGGAALLGKKPSECPRGPNSELYEAKINEVFATGKNAQFELKWLGKEGKEVCSHIRLTAERDLSGNIISVLAVGRDITELNEYRAELKRKELAKTRFLAAAGHDLRQPLTAANMFIYALKSTALTPKQNGIIQRLDRSMSTFGGLLDALLNVSKLDAGLIKPEFTSINVPELIIWLEQNFVPVAGEKQLDFKLYFSMKETLFVRSDIGLLKSVLMNLVSNAIKFTSSGAILVGARRRGSDVLFQVWDTGIGIPDECIEYIFDEFYQIGNPQRDRTSGLGLGLSIAKRSLGLLESKIRCRSQIGRGTVFEFRLALADLSSVVPQREATVASPQNVVDHLFAIGKKFIVVEDDMLVAQATTACLEEMGGAVKCFHSAEDALFHANAEYADYYIVDYMLGGTLSGIQFLNLLRQQSGKSINAVLVTGDTSGNFISQAAEFDWPVLFKPVNVSGLFASLSAQEGGTV